MKKAKPGKKKLELKRAKIKAIGTKQLSAAVGAGGHTSHTPVLSRCCL